MSGQGKAAGRTEGAVVALMAGAGQDALVGMIERTIRPSFRLARAILLDDREAEDAVQDACIRAWRSRSALRDPALFRPWFDRILINVCRDQIRARQRQRVRAIALQHTLAGQAATATSTDKSTMPLTRSMPSIASW